MQRSNNCDKIKSFFESNEMHIVENIVATVGEELICIDNPAVGVAIKTIRATVKAIVDNADEIKLKYLLSGIAAGFNHEKFGNELANYVAQSEDRAFFVENTFRKMLTSESRIAIYLMGVILANRASEKAKPSQSDIILCRCLENASDKDLLNFLHIMQKCTNANGEIRLEQSERERAELELTCDWGVYNRVFKSSMGEVFEYGDESVDMRNPSYDYQVTPISRKLFDYILGVPGYIIDR